VGSIPASRANHLEVLDSQGLIDETALCYIASVQKAVS
jgi:hypothetical protein